MCQKFMAKELSELTLILHEIDINNFFKYKRADNFEEINPENIEFLRDYPNPILVSSRTANHVKLINPDYIPQRANALVIGYGKKEGKKAYIYPAVYCHVEGLAENQ